MQPTREELRIWVRAILERTGQRPSQLARAAGLATTTLTRFLAQETGGYLDTATIAKIARAAGVEPLGLPRPSATARPGTRAGGMAEADAAPYQSLSTEKSGAAVIDAMIAGRNATDPWVLQSNALSALGYLPGDILIVDLNRRAGAGDVVCAQVYSRADTADTVFRVYEPPYLVAASLDPVLGQRLRRPLIVDHERVVIMGVVTDVWRRAPRAA